jgi:hypothetical protein
MSDVEFWQTRAGRIFYEKTLPELVKQIQRLAEAVERLTERLDADDDGEHD